MNTLFFENINFIIGILVVTFFQGLFYAAQRSILYLHCLVFIDNENTNMPNDSMFREIITKAEKFIRTLRNTQTFLNICFGIILSPFLVNLYMFHEEPSWLLSFIIAVFFIWFYCFFGYTIPNLLSQKCPESILNVTTPILFGIRKSVTPLLSIVSFFTKRFFLKWIKINPNKNMDFIDEEIQLRALSNEKGIISKTARSIFRNAKKMSELEVSDILMPRSQVQYFDLNNSIDDNLEIAKKTGHTRFPLCENELDNVIGIIHIKDLFRFRGNLNRVNLEKISRHILKFRPNEPLEDALAKFLKYKAHMAQVVDEFDGTVGFIALEDILEELVGEIQDEFDAEESVIKEIRQNVYKVSGLAPIHDVEEILEISIDDERFSTIGGIVTSEIGRIPEKNEKLDILGLKVTIDDVDERRIISMTIEKNDDLD